MIIRKIEDKDLEDFINYNVKIYPFREKIEESIYYRFSYNPYCKTLPNENLIVRDKNNNIVGQVLMMPSELIYNKSRHPVYWAIDFFVDELNRGYTGFILAKKASEIRYHFGVAVSQVALKLHLALGEKIVGYFVKYIKFRSLLSIFKLLIPFKIKKHKNFIFPEYLEIKGGKFIRVYNPEDIIASDGYWNEDLIEFSRNKNFINWRFLFYKNKYFIYKYTDNTKRDNSNPTYFVVRIVIWRNIYCLLLVDYRFSYTNIEMLKKILNATTKLARRLKVEAIIVGCSLPLCNQLIRKQMFMKFGIKSVIVTKFLNDKKNINLEENIIFVTFADSDRDFYYDNYKS